MSVPVVYELAAAVDQRHPRQKALLAAVNSRYFLRNSHRGSLCTYLFTAEPSAHLVRAEVEKINGDAYDSQRCSHR